MAERHYSGLRREKFRANIVRPAMKDFA